MQHHPSEQKPSTCGKIEEAFAVRLQVESSKARELLRPARTAEGVRPCPPMSPVSNTSACQGARVESNLPDVAPETNA